MINNEKNIRIKIQLFLQPGKKLSGNHCIGRCRQYERESASPAGRVLCCLYRIRTRRCRLQEYPLNHGGVCLQKAVCCSVEYTELLLLCQNSSASFSISERLFSLRALMIVTVVSANVTSFDFSNIPFMILAATGPQDPFSMRPTFLFW